MLVVDGLLLDFKSTRRPLAEMSQRTAWQLAGYLLLDAADRYRIDTVGLYLTRSGVLAPWSVDDYLALLGACHRDLTALRRVSAELLAGCEAGAWYFATEEETKRVRQLLERLAPAPAAAWCAPGPYLNPPAGPGSSAPPGAADAPTSSVVVGCSPDA